MKNREAQIPIHKALDLIEKLGITQYEYATTFCGLKGDRAFYQWLNRGTMPANRFNASQNELAKYFKKEYDRKCEIIWGKDE
jgi:hypothetical protein